MPKEWDKTAPALQKQDSFATDISGMSSSVRTRSKMDSLIMSAYDSQKNEEWRDYKFDLHAPIPSEASFEQYNLYSETSDVEDPANTPSQKKISVEETVDD